MRWRGRGRRPQGDRGGSSRRPWSNISLATRLAVVALLVTLVSLAVTATVGMYRGNQLADGLAGDRVVAIAASQADAVELYFRGVQNQVTALASSPATRDAIADLGEAYVELAAQPIDSSLDDELNEFYTTQVVPALEEVRGGDVGPSLLVPEGAGGIYLQANYTVPQIGDDGERVDPVLVLDPGDGSTYSERHPPIHHAFAQIRLRSGFDDLLLVDARRGVVVYSVSKRTDFATSLDLGPLSGSSLARLIDSIESEPTAGTALVADLAAYPPAADRPTAFVASPVIVDDGELVGYMVAALAIDPLDAVLSVDGSWRGFPDSGSAYLAGSDGTMRSTAREFEQSPATYLAESTEPGPGELTDAQRRRIVATGTTALAQPVNRATLALAETGAGTVRTTDFRGIEVLSAYRPVEVDGISWVILAEAPTEVLDEPIEEYSRNMLFAIALFVVVVTFITARWSNRLMAPIRAIATRLRRAHGVAIQPDAALVADRVGDDTIGDDDLPTRSPREYEELTSNIDQMLERLEDHQRAVAARAAERGSLARQFLPARMARRSDEGDADMIDHAPQASVVALVLDGSEGSARSTGFDDDPDLRSMLGEIVDEADALASDHGLDRVKSTGGAYVAVCGVGRPLLDHAPRSVAFALALRDAVDDMSGGRLSIRGAVDGGAVSAGLAARTGLLYDAWGPAVEAAEELARRSPAGTITVSGFVRRQLPREFVVADADEDPGAPVVVTGRLSEGATS